MCVCVCVCVGGGGGQVLTFFCTGNGVNGALGMDYAKQTGR